MQNKYILKDGILLSMEQRWQPEIKDVVIEHDVIKNVTNLTDEELNSYISEGYIVINMSNKVVMPGFVNTHGHAGMTLLRSYADDLPLQEWLETKIWPFEAKLTADDIYYGTKLAIVEMLETGTTCFTDMYFEMDKVAEAVKDTGIRACLSRGLIGLAPNGEQALQDSISFIKKWQNAANGRITCTLGPHALYTCPPTYLEKVIKTARELNVALQIHVDETAKEHEDCLATYGKTPVQHLADLDVFSQHVIAAHCVHLDDNDIETFKKYDVKVAHNPTSNLKLGSGIAPIGKYLANDITVGIGTDGCSSNNNLDMLEELQLTALIHKGANLDPLLLPAKKVLEMATIDGAKVLGLEDKIGSIVIGKQADIIAFDLCSSLYVPKFDIISLLVYSANSRDITDVFVAGQHLVKSGVIDIDKNTIINKVQDIADRIVGGL